MRKQFCQACSFARHGVKTRKSIPHTCGGNHTRRQKEWYIKPETQYVPTREELEKYLKRLQELMEGK